MQNKSFTIRIVLAIAAIFMAVSAFAGIPQRPSPQRLVNDFAECFTPEQRELLEAKLVAFDDTTSNQIMVVTVADLDGYDPNEYALEIGRLWGVGNKDFNNGVVVLVKPKNDNGKGQVSIQVGYGLEGAITDVYSKRIIESIMIPRFKENDYYGAIDEACTKLMALASGEISVQRELEDDEPSLVSYILGIIFLYFVYKWSMRGGGSGSGGSYSGGGGHIFIGPIGGGYSGGHSHGGGHSGGFGGFGGGSFGGGGASGSW